MNDKPVYMSAQVSQSVRRGGKARQWFFITENGRHEPFPIAGKMLKQKFEVIYPFGHGDPLDGSEERWGRSQCGCYGR